MPRSRPASSAEPSDSTSSDTAAITTEELPTGVEGLGGESDEAELVPEGKLVCALTGEYRTATPQEETLQSFIEQLHREYDIALSDMERDFRVSCVSYDESKARDRSRNRSVSLVAYEPDTAHEAENVTHI